MKLICKGCARHIRGDEMFYQSRKDKRDVKCVACVANEANAGADLTKTPDDPLRYKPQVLQ